MHCSQNLSKRFSWSLAGRWESANISVRSYLLIIPKHSVTHMRGLLVLVSFARDLAGPRFFLHGTSGKLWILIYIFGCLYFIRCLTSFYCVDYPFLCICIVFDANSCNKDEVLLIKWLISNDLSQIGSTTLTVLLFWIFFFFVLLHLIK